MKTTAIPCRNNLFTVQLYKFNTKTTRLQAHIRIHIASQKLFLYSLLEFFSDVNDCLRLDWTCENGGQQVDTGKSCKCQCAPGFNGHHCEIGQSLMSYNFKTGSLRVASLQCISRKTKTNAPRPRYASKYKHFLSTYAKKQNHRQQVSVE